MIRRALAASLLLALAGTGTAMADDDCRVPMDRWQPPAAVQRMAESRGWKVERIRIDDGCYQIRGTDENGRRIRVKVDPASLAIVKMKRESRDHGRADAWQESAASGGAAAVSALALTTARS